MLRGVPPFLSQKYQLKNHPRFKELQMDHSDYVYHPDLNVTPQVLNVPVSVEPVALMQEFDEQTQIVKEA